MLVGLAVLVALPVVVIVLVVRASNKKSRKRSAAFVQSQLPPPPPTGSWYADLTGRFEQRWWSGEWTSQVTLASGQQSTDPSPLPEPALDPPAGR